MLAPELNQPERPSLFLLSPATENPAAEGDTTTARVRLRLRKWEARRTWAGRALIALSFPLAFVLVMYTGGHHSPVMAARFVIWLWVTALMVGIVCAEAVWRNTFRLERMVGERLPGYRG